MGRPAGASNSLQSLQVILRGMSACTSTSIRVFHGQSLFGRLGHEDSFCSLVNLIFTCESRLAAKSLVFVINPPSIPINPYSSSS
jgi:hypothetical protein